jgi:glycerol-3-phosphate dehydrogenase subunit C
VLHDEVPLCAAAQFDLDFPHLMLRHRAVEHRKGLTSFADQQLSEMDRNGRLGTVVSGLANWATKEGNGLTRPVIERHRDRRARASAAIHGCAVDPAGAGDRARAQSRWPRLRQARWRSMPGAMTIQRWTPGLALVKVLAHNGVQVRIEHPDCCGMPKFENGDLPAWPARPSGFRPFRPLIEAGWDRGPLTTSCALMLKFEWPLIEPDNAAVNC